MNKKIYYERPKHPQTGTKSIQKNASRSVNDEPYMSTEQQEQQYYQPSYKAPVYEKRNPVFIKGAPVKEAIANLALILLSVTLVIFVITLVTEIHMGNYTYKRDAQDFWYAIEYGNYSNMVTMKWDNEAKGVYKTSELKQCYAVADYFEAASLYKASAYKEDTEAMQKYANKMNEAYILLDDISYVAEEIDAKLGLEIAR